MQTFIVFVVVALFATLAAAYAGAVRSSALRRKFEALGKIPGRPQEEILRHVGEPHKRVKLGANRTAKPWTAEGNLFRLHIGLEGVDDLKADLGAAIARYAAAR